MINKKNKYKLQHSKMQDKSTTGLSQSSTSHSKTPSQTPSQTPSLAPSQPPSENSYFTGSAIFGNIIQGMALGSGSQLAGRAIDKVMGPRQIDIQNVSNNLCTSEYEAYNNCLKNNINEFSNCNELLELLSKCKKNEKNM